MKTMLHRLCRVRFWLIASLLFAGALRVAAATDEQVIAQMQREVKALQAKMVANSDLKEVAQLQTQMGEVMEKALKQLSPKARPMFAIGLKLVQPLQNDAVAYTQAASAFFGGKYGDFRNLKSRDDIAASVKAVDQLDASNQKLLGRINSLETDAETLLKKEGVGERDRAEFIEGFRQSTIKQMGALRAVRNLDSKMYAQWKNALALLDQEWGKWHVKGNAPISWDNPESEKKLATIVGEIQRLADRQAQAQQQLLNR